MTKEERELVRSKKPKAKEEKKGQIVLFDEEQKNKVEELLLLGIKKNQICKAININHELFDTIKKFLIQYNKITQEQIKTAVEERKNKNKEIIRKLLLEGYSHSEIVDKIRYIGKTYISSIKDELKTEGKITDEEIEEAKAKRERENLDLVYQGLNQGMSYKEIESSDKLRGLTLNTIAKYKNELIKSGKITEEKIKEKRVDKETLERKERQANYESPYDEKIKRLCELGFKTKEIAIIIEISLSYTEKRIRALKAKGEIVDSEIAKSRKNKEQNDSVRKSKIVKMSSYNLDYDTSIVQEYIDCLKANFKLGNPDKKELKLLSEVVLLDEQGIKLSDVNFITINLSKMYGYTKALNFIKQYMEVIKCDNINFIKAKKELEKIIQLTKTKNHKNSEDITL